MADDTCDKRNTTGSYTRELSQTQPESLGQASLSNGHMNHQVKGSARDVGREVLFGQGTLPCTGEVRWPGEVENKVVCNHVCQSKRVKGTGKA